MMRILRFSHSGGSQRLHAEGILGLCLVIYLEIIRSKNEMAILAKTNFFPERRHA